MKIKDIMYIIDYLESDRVLQQNRLQVEEKLNEYAKESKFKHLIEKEEFI